MASTAASSAGRPLVTLLGGGGFLGRAVTSSLLKLSSPPDIRIVTRTNRSHVYFQQPTSSNLEKLVLDVTKPAHMESALSNCTHAVNLIGLLYESRGKGRTFSEAHITIPKLISTYISKNPLQSHVHISAIGAESTSKSSYARTKAAGESHALSASAVVLRPSIIYGPSDNFFNRFADMSKFLPFLPAIGGGYTRFQPVHVEDVAEAVVRALALSEPKSLPTDIKGVYELGGRDVLTFRELMEMVLRITERKRLIAPVPFPIAALQAAFFEALHTVIPALPPLLTRDQIELLRVHNVVSDSAKTFSDMGIEPRGCTDAHVSYIRGA